MAYWQLLTAVMTWKKLNLATWLCSAVYNRETMSGLRLTRGSLRLRVILGVAAILLPAIVLGAAVSYYAQQAPRPVDEAADGRSLSQARATRPGTDAGNRTIIFIFAASVIGFLGAALIVRTVTTSVLHPLGALTDSANRFAAGQLDHRIDRLPFDELDSLGQAFNVMAEKLETNLRELKDSESRFRAISATAVDAIVSIDADSRIIFTNPAAEGCFGYGPGELLGQEVYVIMPDRFRHLHRGGVSRHLATGISRAVGGSQLELVGLKKDGTEFPIELSLASHKHGDQAAFTGIIRDITARKKNEQLLRRLSVTDSLTGLLNHGEFYRQLGEELERSRRYGGPVAVLMLDIDQFKAVNDDYGHQAGDAVLRALAELITELIRPTDKVARYGGEEFGVILPETEEPGALAMAERIRLAVADRAVRVDGTRTINITVSIGAAVFSDPARTEEQLVGEADQALYAAKQAGRNRVAVLP
jgi:diguanylate cyclase (GGDEF)-like protein/PAS domain S-box-containing protein